MFIQGSVTQAATTDQHRRDLLCRLLMADH
jgi:hypothetical protein